MNDLNWDAIGALGEVAGAVGVIVTLIYLAIQVRQNTSVTRASTAQHMTNNWVLVNLEMTRSQVTTKNIDFSMPPDELQIVLSFWRSMFHQWSNCQYQYRHGSLDELLYLPTEMEMSHFPRDQTIGPNLRAAWSVTRFVINAEFQQFVDDIIENNPIDSVEVFKIPTNDT